MLLRDELTGLVESPGVDYVLHRLSILAHSIERDQPLFTQAAFAEVAAVEFLTIVLGLPLLISLLALPFLIIATPFRWRHQSRRIQSIEDRLVRLEGRSAQGSPRLRFSSFPAGCSSGSGPTELSVALCGEVDGQLLTAPPTPPTICPKPVSSTIRSGASSCWPA